MLHGIKLQIFEKKKVVGNIFNDEVFTCDMKFVGNGALDTSLEYICSFSIVLIFVHMYKVLKVPEVPSKLCTCEQISRKWEKSKCILVMGLSFYLNNNLWVSRLKRKDRKKMLGPTTPTFPLLIQPPLRIRSSSMILTLRRRSQTVPIHLHLLMRKIK